MTRRRSGPSASDWGIWRSSTPTLAGARPSGTGVARAAALQRALDGGTGKRAAGEGARSEQGVLPHDVRHPGADSGPTDANDTVRAPPRPPGPSRIVVRDTRPKAGTALRCQLPTTAHSAVRIINGIAVPTEWPRPKHHVRHSNAILLCEFCKRLEQLLRKGSLISPSEPGAGKRLVRLP